MRAALQRPRRRGLAAWICAGLFTLSGCGTNPYVFSPRLNTYRMPGDGADAPKEAPVPLAGRLDLALIALMHQRDQLWAAANDTETLKNWTAVGLIGLGAVGLYKGLDAEIHKTWLRKAGLGAAAVYAGANWFEPTARQRIYLAGAMSLTCMALTVAPYEMKKTEFDEEVKNLHDARDKLERLYAALAMVPSNLEPASKDKVRNAEGFKRFATAILNSADETLGNIEKVGTRLRDMTALTASKVSNEVSSTSKDLPQLETVIKSLQPQANLLLGSQIFAPPPPQSANDEKPDTSADSAKAKSTDAASGGSCAAPKAAPTRPPPTPSETKHKDNKAVEPPSAALQAANLSNVEAALLDLSKPLGRAISLVRRVQAARAGQELPAACGIRTVNLFPVDRSIVLQPGGSFQYLLSGDEGRPAVQLMTAAPPNDVLDISLPATQAATTIRFTAGPSINKQVDTIVRINDSGKTQQFDINVRVCASLQGA